MNEGLSIYANKILDLLRQRGEWMKRSEIAKGLGRKRLTGSHLTALAILEERKLIEVEKRPDNRPIGLIFFYRAIND
ncbi:hypothetical protein HYS03_02470 [Candidatus Woesebacteria bacterium]|nr:hypothetical protein [Candidatus Woesebacteria bacterium]QQG47129.1 MAG: hypothetical protein HY044_03225 [Candidatus Woesebacteria bacterium]